MAAVTATPLVPGTVIDGFQLVGPLHKGGMATLWEVVAVDASTAPRDAQGELLPLIMKIPRLIDTDDPTAIVAFEVEQMLMPVLTGQHVPRFIKSGDFTAQPYIVMERVTGKSLRERLDQAPLKVDEVAQIGARVATALHDLHRQHVIHLDLKPSNIMIRPDGTAVMVDFGLSRHDHLPDLLAEEFRLPMGTGPYIAPEQVLRMRHDPRSDMFALGVLLYHFATGTRPFGHPTTIRGLKQRLWRDPVPPRALNKDIPEWFQEVVMRCLDVDPRKRPATGAQVALLLTNPKQVVLTHRGRKLSRDGWWTVKKRWWRAIGLEPGTTTAMSEQLSQAPIVVAALDIVHGGEQLLDAVRLQTMHILNSLPDSRLACVTVHKTHRIAMDISIDTDGQSFHVKRLVDLKHWARDLNLPGDRVTFHVLEAPDAAAAIVDYAATNQVDHIVIGSRGNSTLRRYLGSVSAQVVAEAPCTVTVVRLPPLPGEAANPANAQA